MCDKSEKATIVNGVVLTDKTIGILKDLQEADNHLIRHSMEKISDTICYVSQDLSNIEDLKQVGPMIQELSFIRNLLKELSKP